MITVGETAHHILVNFKFETILSCREAFKDLVNLQKIDLEIIQLSELPGHIFRNCKEIKEINSSFNNLTSLNKTLFWGLEKLTYLDLHKNKLSLIDG